MVAARVVVPGHTRTPVSPKQDAPHPEPTQRHTLGPRLMLCCRGLPHLPSSRGQGQTRAGRARSRKKEAPNGKEPQQGELQVVSRSHDAARLPYHNALGTAAP